MARKDYYYITTDESEEKLHCCTSTGNIDHQKKIEKHIKDKSSKCTEGTLTGELIKVKKMVKYLDVDGKEKIKDMDFVTLLEPLVLTEVIAQKDDLISL